MHDDYQEIRDTVCDRICEEGSNTCIQFFIYTYMTHWSTALKFGGMTFLSLY